MTGRPLADGDRPGRHRGGLGHQLAFALTGALTTWVALWSWRGFTVDSGAWLAPLLVLALLVAATGALGRWARVPGPLLVAGQVVSSALVGAALLVGSAVPTSATIARLGDLFGAAATSAQAYAAPVPTTVPGIHPLLVAGGLGCLLATDALAGTLHRASLAGLPLLTAYALPVSMLGAGASWQVFVLVAAGFLLLLALQEDDQVDRWGRNLAGGRSAVLGRPGAARTGAGVIGGLATASALVLPLAVPTLSFTVFDGGVGAGGDGEIELDNPMVDLTRDLKSRDATELVRVRTDDPTPGYLRITVLERFGENTWSSGDRDLPEGATADGEPFAEPGVAPSVVARSRSFSYDYAATDDFASEWLPTPFPALAVAAPGSWKYDAETLDFLATDDDGLDTSELDWSAVGVDPRFDEATLEDATDPVGQVDPVYTELPPDLPPVVEQLAEQETAGEDTALGRARALQRFFRVDGGFEYTLEADAGNGGDALVEFLSADTAEGRRGYCEQFASAMAVMARTLGIPSRVALGFLSAERVGEDEYLYREDDLHAWPELYFAGSGWVRFEPTPGGPGGRTQAPPSWSVGPVTDRPSLPDEGGLGQAPLDPQRRQQDVPAPAPVEDGAVAEDGAAEDAGVAWRDVGAAAGGLLLLVAVTALPRSWRTARSNRRWGAVADGSAPSGATAWRELRDGCADLGVAWPRGRSPESTRAALLPAMTTGPVAAGDALTRIVRTVEQQWYAAPGDGAADDSAADRVRADVELVLEALAAGVSAPARARARWLPASLWQRRSSRPRSGARAGVDQVG